MLNKKHPDFLKLKEFDLAITQLTITQLFEDKSEQIDAELQNKQTERQLFWGQTVGNAYWDGYKEAGDPVASASIFIDGLNLWTNNGRRLAWGERIGPISVEQKMPLDNLITKEKLLELAKSFQAKTSVKVEDCRYFQEETGLEIPGDDIALLLDSDGVYFFEKLTWELLIDQENIDKSKFYFTPNLGKPILQAEIARQESETEEPDFQTPSF